MTYDNFGSFDAKDSTRVDKFYIDDKNGDNIEILERVGRGASDAHQQFTFDKVMESQANITKNLEKLRENLDKMSASLDNINRNNEMDDVSSLKNDCNIDEHATNAKILDKNEPNEETIHEFCNEEKESQNCGDNECLIAEMNSKKGEINTDISIIHESPKCSKRSELEAKESTSKEEIMQYKKYEENDSAGIAIKKNKEQAGPSATEMHYRKLIKMFESLPMTDARFNYPPKEWNRMTKRRQEKIQAKFQRGVKIQETLQPEFKEENKKKK